MESSPQVSPPAPPNLSISTRITQSAAPALCWKEGKGAQSQEDSRSPLSNPLSLRSSAQELEVSGDRAEERPPVEPEPGADWVVTVWPGALEVLLLKNGQEIRPDPLQVTESKALSSWESGWKESHCRATQVSGEATQEHLNPCPEKKRLQLSCTFLGIGSPSEQGFCSARRQGWWPVSRKSRQMEQSGKHHLRSPLEPGIMG